MLTSHDFTGDRVEIRDSKWGGVNNICEKWVGLIKIDCKGTAKCDAGNSRKQFQNSEYLAHFDVILCTLL